MSDKAAYQTYVVGGALRDALLGLPVQDCDYVVVGAAPAQLEAAGFRLVGKDFPVFLHPHTHAEYALARTERKTAKGYKGFQVFYDTSVTLVQDLQRRDLTINAMAQAVDEQGAWVGDIIDPYAGQADLQAKLFRHVSDAFVEDPVRILRVARFAARFTDFDVAPTTLQLMRDMVAQGEVEALVPERVWQEMSRGLMAQQPSRMIEVLRQTGALARLMPELDQLFGVPQPLQHHPEGDTGIHIKMVVDYAAQCGHSLPIRFAALLHDLGKGLTPADLLPRHIGHEAKGIALVEQVCQRFKVPTECRDLALLVAREHGTIGRANEMKASTVVRLFDRCDAWRKPARFAEVLLACECDFKGRPGYADRTYDPPRWLLPALDAARGVDAGMIAQQYLDQPMRIKEKLCEARVAAVEASLEKTR